MSLNDSQSIRHFRARPFKFVGASPMPKEIAYSNKLVHSSQYSTEIGRYLV